PNRAGPAADAPPGAALTYSPSTALPDTATQPDTGPAPPSARRTRPAKLVILSAQGDTVRVLEGERRPGLNRVWWDLRYAAPAVPKLRTAPPGKPFVRVGAEGTRPLVTWDLDLSLRGPLVPPGSYTVRLTVADTSPTTLTQSLTVLKDPNTAGSDAD